MTYFYCFGRSQLEISIHTLRVEGDPILAIHAGIVSVISIHTLRVEGDRSCGDFGTREF